MLIEEKLNENLSREYKIVVPVAQVKEEIEKRAESFAKTASIPGFRKGKVPASVIKTKHKDSLNSEVVQHFIDSGAREAIIKNDLKLASKPMANSVKFVENEDLQFNISIELMPQIPNIDYEKIKLVKNIAKPGEKEINQVLENMQKGQRVFEPLPKTTKAKKGMAVLIDAKGYMDGKEFAEGNLDNRSLELGANEFIPGFEDGLIGSKAGDSKTLNLHFPKDYWQQRFADKDVTFEVNVKEVQNIALPKIDDDFAKKSNIDTLQALKDEIAKLLQDKNDEKSEVLLKKDVFDYLDQNVALEIPPKMLEAENKYLDTSSKETSKDNKELAVRRVKIGLILADIAKENKIEVTAEDAKAAVLKQASANPSQAKAIIDFYQKDKNAIEALKGNIIENKAFKFILDKVTLTEKEITQDKLLEILKELDKS